ncbi:hypothetical protein [Streptomyces sp. NPDC021020]|uniref:hypothetical protein n=1 Tax=Streptomyces sp. NPDC021020 TaxID=3365109 RepID=UPI0037ACA534
MSHVFRRAAAVMALGLSMVVGAAGYSQASPASARHSGQVATANAAVTCPGPGHRFKVSGDPTVYLTGPGGTRYYFPDSSDYNGLWTSYSGISTVSTSCVLGLSYALNSPILVKVTGSSAVYIYDSWNGGYRWITTQSVFDKYGFASSKIQHWSSIDKSSILTGLPWSG